jgi:hypothetical protein
MTGGLLKESESLAEQGSACQFLFFFAGSVLYTG